MKAIWKRDCKTSDQERDVKEALANGKEAFKLLRKILEGELESSYSAQVQKSNYDSPGWAQYQADFVGSQRTYKKVLDLISDL